MMPTPRFRGTQIEGWGGAIPGFEIVEILAEICTLCLIGDVSNEMTLSVIAVAVALT